MISAMPEKCRPLAQFLLLLSTGLFFVDPAAGWSFTIEKTEDIICTGGAGWSHYPGGKNSEPNVRGGGQNTIGVCRLKMPAPEPIRHVSFTYKYAAGYRCDVSCEGATVMTVWATDQTSPADESWPGAGQKKQGLLYTSPPLNRASGDKYDGGCSCPWCSTCYKAVQDVSAYCPFEDQSGSKHKCGAYVTLVFVNTDHNVQLLLPMTITVNEHAWGWSFMTILCGAMGLTCERPSPLSPARLLGR